MMIRRRRKVNSILQHDSLDCGPTCLYMIADSYGKEIPINYLREISSIDNNGTSIANIKDAAEELGFNNIAINVTIDKIQSAPLPCILYWGESHFIVLSEIKQNILTENKSYVILDPAHGKLIMQESEFVSHWIHNKKEKKGSAILFEPTEEFYDKVIPKEERKYSFRYFIKQIFKYKRLLAAIFFSLLFGSLISLIFPYLMQILIDKGIGESNINIIYIVLFAQLALTLSATIFDFIKSRVLLFIGSFINIELLSNFLGKVMSLPLKFFTSRNAGDFSYRVVDIERIHAFFTSESIPMLFSTFNFVIFFIILANYNISILLIHLLLSLVGVYWSSFFIEKIKKYDYYLFRQRSEQLRSINEVSYGIKEIKINGLESFLLNKWNSIQYNIFDINHKSLFNNQMQIFGFNLINQIKNIVIIFIAVTQVLAGNLTVGAILSITYILGQLDAPFNQYFSFIKSFNEVKLSISRVNQIENLKEEDAHVKNHTDLHQSFSYDKLGPITIKNLSFQYNGKRSPVVLDNINLTIPEGKMTAIVGESGGGKTTLLSLLLKFYSPINGYIYYGDENLHNISAAKLRERIGVVMQDGFLFDGTIERNIIGGDQEPDLRRLNDAIKTANLNDFISSLPKGLNTHLNLGGNTLSGGQIQRLLIARAVYKNPTHIFFDEATSNLDTINESIIYKNLELFFKGRTSVVIAHRLSTVRNADQIIVINKGKIAEIGNHEKLISKNGYYAQLIRNQL